MSDLDEQIERLKRCEYLKEQEVKALCDKAREILIDESNVQRVDAPVTICGDIRHSRVARSNINLAEFKIGLSCNGLAAYHVPNNKGHVYPLLSRALIPLLLPATLPKEIVLFVADPRRYYSCRCDTAVV